ncbi:LysR family transcriptional regulator substrate-binding protein, partial [Alistipes onderdonkii]|nr:LysR family transcriptional regulator substrate-binding protein [Alistipes onderdonkii]
TMELANIQKALNENEIDVGLSIYQDGIQGAKFCYRRLYEDRYMLAVPVGHRLAKRASVSIADLRGERVVVPHFNR